MMMIPTKLFIEPKQEAKIRKALHKQTGCRIKTRKINRSESGGNHLKGLVHGELLLTKPQWKRYQKAKHGDVVSLPFQHKHLAQNMKHKGGFLPLIAALLAPVIGGVAGGLIVKEIAGSGIHPSKLIWYKHSPRKQATFYIEPAPHGKGLYLSPWKGNRANLRSGSGLYLSPYPHKAGSGISMQKLQHGLPSQMSQFSPMQRKCIHELL